MGRKVTLLNYLRVDLYRAVISWRFLAGIIGVAFTMYRELQVILMSLIWYG